MNKKILIIEDDENITCLERDYLEAHGFEVLCANDGQKGLEIAKTVNVALVLLDVMLPSLNGLEVCKKIREFSNIPILLVSAKKDEFDKINGLGFGADDYIVKPFSPSELVARVDALYRRVAIAEMRTENNFKEEIRSGDFALNLRNHTLTKRGQLIDLTQVEFQIMEYFFSSPGAALDRGDILRHVWGENYVGEEKIVDVNIRRLRMKIEDNPSSPKNIVTVWGLGYKWEA